MAEKSNLGIIEGIGAKFMILCSSGKHLIEQVWVFCGGSEKKEVLAK